jgi:hypothetical protein
MLWFYNPINAMPNANMKYDVLHHPHLPLAEDFVQFLLSDFLGQRKESSLALGVQNKRDNKPCDSQQHSGRQPHPNLPIEAQDFAKNENQNHANEDSRLQHVSSDALVANNADAVSGRKTSEPDGQAAGKVHKATVLRVSHPSGLMVNVYIQGVGAEGLGSTDLNKLYVACSAPGGMRSWAIRTEMTSE